MTDKRHSSGPETTPGDLGGALRAVFRILDSWGLRAEQARAVLGVPRQTYYRWRRDPAAARLDANTLERLSYVLGIFKGLQVLLPDEAAAHPWLHRPNNAPVFGGKPPLERLLAGQVADLYEVRRFVDGACGGWN
jgi:uncharacterized protein (DUF2384 family)